MKLFAFEKGLVQGDAPQLIAHKSQTRADRLKAKAVARSAAERAKRAGRNERVAIKLEMLLEARAKYLTYFNEVADNVSFRALIEGNWASEVADDYERLSQSLLTSLGVAEEFLTPNVGITAEQLNQWSYESDRATIQPGLDLYSMANTAWREQRVAERAEEAIALGRGHNTTSAYNPNDYSMASLMATSRSLEFRDLVVGSQIRGMTIGGTYNPIEPPTDTVVHRVTKRKAQVVANVVICVKFEGGQEESFSLPEFAETFRKYVDDSNEPSLTVYDMLVDDLE